ncbi:MAG: VTT domain-containing protein [Acidobacteria bacterium]|nr:VTT domain-containing protein [Acidobacteriota bacterium]
MYHSIRKHIAELGRLTPLGIVSMLLPIVGSALLIGFIVPIGQWMRANWESGVFVFLGSVLFFCGFALLATNVIGVVSGWAFGFQLGLLVLISGIVGAAVISFFLNKRITGEKLQEALQNHPRSRAIYNALLREDLRKTTLIIFLVRVSVVMPFAFTNFVLAAGRVPLGSYVIGTTAGMLPRAAATSYVGAGMYDLDLSNARDTTIFIIGLAATIISVFVIGYISRRALDHVTRDHQTADIAET